jgi:cell division septal protein FtsQ
VSKAEPLYHPMRPRASTRRKNKRRIVRALFKSIATVAIVAGAAWSLSGYFITSPRFALQNVEVSGLRVLSKEEVAQVAPGALPARSNRSPMWSPAMCGASSFRTACSST